MIQVSKFITISINLSQVIKETAFPWNPKEALRNGFLAAEKAFQELA